MLDPRLSSLISQIFVPDPDIKKLFASEILESLEIDLAWEDVDGGVPISDECFSPFVGFTRYLHPNPEHQRRLYDFDVSLSATLARLLDTRNNFFVALWREDSAGGPYVHVVKTSEKFEVSLLSNYRMLERRENWFSAALSLFQWHTMDTDFLGMKIYRKAWGLDNDPVDIATAISLVVTYVLDALAGGRALIQTPQLRDEVLEQQMQSGQIWPVIDDASVGWRLVEKADKKGFHPPLSTNRGSMDAVIAQFNIREALNVASQRDDETGISTLTQLLHDIEKRDGYFKPVYEQLREFVSLSHNIESVRILPEDHPLFEDFGSGKNEGEDYDFDAEGDGDINFLDTSTGMMPALNTKVGEEQEDTDSPTIFEGTNDELWALAKVFNGAVKISPENEEDETFLLAYLLGSYLRNISGFSELHSVKVFAQAFEARGKQNGQGLPAFSEGGPNPTVLNAHGVYVGVVERMRQRAAKVFETLLAIKDIDDSEERARFISELSDETLMDCKIWTMVKTWGNPAIDPPRSLFMLIDRCASYPRI